jgi:hypothetical protein
MVTICGCIQPNKQRERKNKRSELHIPLANRKEEKVLLPQLNSIIIITMITNVTALRITHLDIDDHTLLPVPELRKKRASSNYFSKES